MLNVRGDFNTLKLKKITKDGAIRLAQEIYRQAVYDWSDPDQRKEVKDFMLSEWGAGLSDLLGHSPGDALRRLEGGVIIDPKDFYSGAGPSLDRYLATKNSRPGSPLLLDSCFLRKKQ